MAAAVRREDLRRTLARAHARDRLAAAEEQFGDVESLIEDAARIAAEIEDDSLRALVQQPIDVRAQLGRRVLAELLQRDVGDLVVEHERVRHGGDVNLRARERVLDRPRRCRGART